MVTVVCHGDSLTEGADLPPGCTWPALTGNALKTPVENTGIGGDTTAGLLARFSADVVAKTPGIVVLLGGTNDLWWDLPVNQILANTFAMASQANYHGIAPVIGLPIPVCVELAERQPFAPPLAGYGACVDKLRELTAALKTSAEGSDMPVIDFHALFVGENGHVNADDYLEDGLHLNRSGHRRMARAAAAVLRHEFMLD